MYVKRCHHPSCQNDTPPSLVIELLDPSISLNKTQSKDWTVYVGEKRKVLNEVMYEMETQSVIPKHHSHLHIERRSTKLLDYDNLVGGLKPTLDVLRIVGLLNNDDPHSVDVFYSQDVTRRAWVKTIMSFWL